MIRSYLARRSLLLGAAAGVISPAHAAGERLSRAGLIPSLSDDFKHLTLWGSPGGTWRPVFGSGGPSSLTNRNLTNNAELQIYMDPEFAGPNGTRPLGINPFSTAEGMLRITASEIGPELSAQLWGRRYVSGLLTSKFFFNQTYGYFEMRAKLPRGRGLWPAFWMDRQDNAWPPELDIMEMLGKDMTTLYTSVHTKQGGKYQNISQGTKVADMSEDFHLYGVYWQPDMLRWYFDDIEVFRCPTPEDLHKPMYLLINLAVGGNWGGPPDASTVFPASMLVSHVRAWRLAA